MQTIVLDNTGSVVRVKTSKETVTTRYISRLCRAKGLKNQNQVANYLGVNRVTAHKWMWGEMGMSEAVAVRVANDLHIDPALVLAQLKVESSEGEVREVWERVVNELLANSPSLDQHDVERAMGIEPTS